MASNSRVRRRQSVRIRDRAVDEDVVLVPGVPGSSTCIDLTDESSIPDDVIDLTNASFAGLIDSPVVVLTPADNVGPMRRRRGSGRRGQRRSRTRQLPHVDILINRSLNESSSVVHLPSDDESDADQAVSPLDGAANNSLIFSPEGVKISCPICLEDAKQIRSSGKRLMATTCGHIFCNYCIQAAISTQRKCPTCRKALTRAKIHPLFL